MIYLDMIEYFEDKIKARIKTIEKHQNKLNEFWKHEKKGQLIRTLIRETERKQKFSKNAIDKYREEIRQLKSLQRDAA